MPQPRAAAQMSGVTRNRAVVDSGEECSLYSFRRPKRVIYSYAKAITAVLLIGNGSEDLWGRLMKDTKRKVALGVSMGLLAAACGSDVSSAGSGSDAGELASSTVVFFGYEDSFLDSVLDPFVESTGMDVKTPAFADEDETETKLRAGFEADVVELCAGEVGSMIESGLLQPVDTSRISAWDSVFDSVKAGEGVIAENGDVYIVPLQGGPFGIVYLAEEVTTPITSYSQLFDPGFDGDIAVSEESISTIWDVAMALGHGPEVDQITDAQVVEAVDVLTGLDTVRTTWSEDGDLVQLFAAGEIIAANHATPDIAEALQDEGINAVYVAPEEGQILWKCGQGISANATNLDGAYALINHYLDPEMQLIFAEEYGYLASNSEILDIAPQELVDDLGLADPGAIDLVTIAEGLPDNEDFWEEEWSRFAG